MTVIEFEKKDFNECYLPHLDNQSRFLVFYGGAGSGKSVFIAQRYLYRCMAEPFFRLVYCRKIARTIRATQYQLFKDLIERGKLWDFFTVKESNMEIICANGNTMLAAGLDDREKIKSLQEPTDIWCEEATEFDKEDIIQLNLRLRTKKAKFNQIVLSFNPISTEHWIYDSFFVKKEFNADVVQTTYKDNIFLPEGYKAQLDALKEQDENYYKVYCLGEWGGSLKGAIYTHWKLTDHIPQFADIVYGLDFGFNHPTALIRVGLAEGHVYAQQVIYQSGLTTADLIQRMREFNMGQTPIYCDNARPETIEELYRAGFNAKPADKGPDSVIKGIDTLKGHPLWVLEDSPDLIKELRNYRWSEDKNGKFVEGKPVKFLDDAVDALRYAVHTHIGRPNKAWGVRIV